MTIEHRIQRVMARVTAGKRAVRVAVYQWGRDPRKGWRAHVHARALAYAAERRAGVLVMRAGMYVN